MIKKSLLLSLTVFALVQTTFAEVCVVQYGYYASQKTIDQLSSPDLGSYAIPSDTKVYSSNTEIGVLKTCGTNKQEFLISPVHFTIAPKAAQAMTESLTKMQGDGYRPVNCKSLTFCYIEK